MNRQFSLNAEVVAQLPLRQFLVALADGTKLTAVFSPGMVGRGERPRIQVGDWVKIERSSYDAGLCRIVGRASRRT